MDYFNRENLIELIEQSNSPAISIYLPIERQNLKKKSVRLQFRNLVDTAEQMMKADENSDPAQYQPMINRLMQWVEDPMFWNYMPDGVAVFLSPGFERVYRVPYAFEPQVVVGGNFHTRPLSQFLLSPDQYWVLSIGQKQVHLWEGNKGGLSPVQVEGLPTDLQDALKLEFEKGQDLVNFHSSFGHNQGRETHHSNSHRGLPGPVYHGHGGGKDDQKAYLREYFNRVDKALAGYLKDKEGPLVLAAVDYLHPIYHEVSKVPNLAKEGIHGNVNYWNEAELHAKAWPIVRKSVDEKVKDALELWERSYGQGKVEMDLSAIAKLTLESRVRTLLIEEGRAIWGQLNRETGNVELIESAEAEQRNGHDPGTDSIDLLDDLAEFVLMRGGKAIAVPAGKMPTRTGAAAILR